MGQVIQKGATSQTLYIKVRDGSTFQGKTGLTNATAGLAFSYTRAGAAAVAIALAAQTPTGAYVSGGFAEVDAVKSPGLYRVDVPDAMLVTGVTDVSLDWTGGGTLDDGFAVTLTDYDPTAVDKSGFSLAANGMDSVTGYFPAGNAP